MNRSRIGARPGARQCHQGIISLLAMAIWLLLAFSSCSQRGDETNQTIVEPTSMERQPIPVETPAPVMPTLTPTAAPTPMPTPEPFRPPDLGYLKDAFDVRLQSFSGIASYYIHDLSGGQVAVHNGDVAISGTSIVKIPILLETYRVMDGDADGAQMRLITETATLSGNYTANLLLELIAGRPDPFAGAQIMTESIRALGLYDTFIAVPYDLNPDPAYFATYLTPANQTGELSTNPDSSMQTTVNDMGRLLAMIFDCSNGAGYLLDVYAGSVTAPECREMLEIMSQNDIDALIEEGVPAGVAVAHKHGWVGDTHGDAALVVHPQYPYVLVLSLYREGWLEWAESTEIIADLSRLAFAHFTTPEAYTEGTLRVGPSALPTPPLMPDLPAATIRGTGGAGVVLRNAPSGDELMIVPEGSLVFLAGDGSVSENGRTWYQIQLLNQHSGWVVADYIQGR